MAMRKTSSSHPLPLPTFTPSRHFSQPLQLHPNPNSNLETLTRLPSLIKSTIRKSHFLQIHAHLLTTALLQLPTFSLSFLSRLSLPPFQDFSYSRQILAQISNPIVSHYNTLIRASSFTKTPVKGFYIYREMLRRGIRPNPLSSSFVTKSCIKISSLIGGLQIHARILKDGHQSDSLLLTTLVDFYSCCAKSDDACNVFDEMAHKDTVAFNVLISCYARNKRTRDALGVFVMMQSGRYGCNPDDVTCLLLLQACAHLCALEFGERVHDYIKEHGYENDLNLRNSLIAMYTRCGCLEKAYQVFKQIPNKDVISWTAMISGLASNGRGREAIEAFQEMLRMGISPSDQTFTGVLSACSHSGLLDEGQMFLNCMSKEYGIVPNIHHYGCVVDLMGRVGLLDEAYQLIISMDSEPDATIWRTLLGACRIHGNFTLGECVIEHLIQLKAQEAGDYVLLLNIYSSAGKWEKVIEVRKLMKEKGIQTSPGCSTIELKGVVHEFVVDDISHPRKNEIYEMLDEIEKQLKIAGYVAEVTSELHKLGAEEKVSRLSYHSEKLAIAFGVLATPPGTALRVAKNLRTCVDCHNFAKMISWVYNREVILRDRTRFHHFKEGKCSCNDYW